MEKSKSSTHPIQSSSERVTIDCRDFPSEKNCTLVIAGTEDEVLKAATEHAVSSHGHQNSSELRETIKQSLKRDMGIGISSERRSA